VLALAILSLIRTEDGIGVVYYNIEKGRRYEYLIPTIERLLTLDGLYLNTLNTVDRYLIATNELYPSVLLKVLFTVE